MVEIVQFGVETAEAETALVRAAVAQALAFERRAGDVTVLLTTGEEIRSLNARFRGIDRVTDVLTFPAWEGETVLSPPDGYLGDIAICTQRAAEQAETYGHSLERELAFLAVHGALHLMGYDHMAPEEETVMRQKQAEILKEMGLSV